MPKSKVRKQTEYVAPSRSGGGASAIKAAAPSPQWYPFVFVGIMVFGLAWIAVYYIAGDRIPFMVSMGSWNFLVGFAALVIGLLLAARWR